MRDAPVLKGSAQSGDNYLAGSLALGSVPYKSIVPCSSICFTP
jgi:hypothetical protein